MDLTWDDEQNHLRDTVRRYLARFDPTAPHAARAVVAGLGDLGLVGLSVAERRGGSGAPTVTEMIVFEELGRALAGGAAYPTVALAAPLLCASDNTTEAARAVVAGSHLAAVAWAGSGSDYHLLGRADGVTIQSGAGGVRLSGLKALVPGAADADVLIVVARDGAYLIDPAADGVSRTPRRSIDPSTQLSDVVLAEALAVPLFGSDAGTAVREVLERATLLAGAEAIGIAEAVLALSQAHTSVRTQFGRPIGGFQAVSHPLVDVYADIELTRSLGLLAASLIEKPGAYRDAVLAGFAMSAAAVGPHACEVAIQVHGGLGMTWDSPLHRYYKRAKVLRSIIGPESVHRALVTTHLSGRTPDKKEPA